MVGFTHSGCRTSKIASMPTVAVDQNALMICRQRESPCGCSALGNARLRQALLPRCSGQVCALLQIIAPS